MFNNEIGVITEQVLVLRKELTDSTQAVNQETKVLTQELSNILISLERRNKQIERQLNDMKRTLYYLSKK